ncbi:trehalose-6-phosphate synthase [Acinetobacter thermotolerans]|uniref:alpha,alpha-trehalose-phosphate synthase (UDP-forming) n=1 Tax=Acinetobacter thermotolerans TaxID=3151487 RepID=UPI00325AB553
MSRLIVLSNRVTLPNPKSTQAGGLAVAIEDALNGIGGIWMGWNGKKTTNRQHTFDVLKDHQIEYHTCSFSEAEYQGYYCGFANGALWPLMHDQNQYIDYTDQDYQIYQDVNLKFARQLQKIAQPSDMIWVQDYHFLSVAHYCRQLGMRNRIGFFLHIPFPETAKWKDLVCAPQLAVHLVQYDLLGLQTQRDQKHCYEFLKTTFALTAHSPNTLRNGQRQVEIKAYPISVHPTAIQRRAEQQASMDLPFDFSADPDVKHIISVDRIDYSKGLLQKVNALRQCFQQSPEMLSQIRQFQIASPCRLEVPTYAHLYRDFQKGVEQLNQEFATEKPVFDCYYDTLSHHALMSLYRKAEICWVNSIYDGMNLVAKEYIAAQDPQDPGILILSKYAGAAEQMKEALIVDPHDQYSMIRALKRAITMPRTERIARYKALFQGLLDYDILHWRDSILKDLKHVGSQYIYRPLSKQKAHHLSLQH